VFKASGITPTQARHIYGFDSMCQSASKVEKAIQDAQNISKYISHPGPSTFDAIWIN